MTAIVLHPLALIAELTHRCPLHCVYCSNPLELMARRFELSTEEWTRVLGEAGKAGILQVDFTGGEPLARPDLVELVQAGRASGLYVNLITSGMLLGEAGKAGILQVDFTGGEPLARPDLVELVQAGRASGLYVNLITSGMPLD